VSRISAERDLKFPWAHDRSWLEDYPGSVLIFDTIWKLKIAPAEQWKKKRFSSNDPESARDTAQSISHSGTSGV
jgi:hypothetical protein